MQGDQANSVASDGPLRVVSKYYYYEGCGVLQPINAQYSSGSKHIVQKAAMMLTRLIPGYRTLGLGQTYTSTLKRVKKAKVASFLSVTGLRIIVDGAFVVFPTDRSVAFSGTCWLVADRFMLEAHAGSHKP